MAALPKNPRRGRDGRSRCRSLFGGVGGWEVAPALVGLPLLATGAARLVVAGCERHTPEALGRRNAICSGPACLLIGAMVAAAVAIDVLAPLNGDAAFWV